MCETQKTIVIPREVGELAEVFPHGFLPDIIGIFRDAYRSFCLLCRDNAGIDDILYLAAFYPDFDPNTLLKFLGFDACEDFYTANPEISSDESLGRLSSFIALLELRRNETPSKPDNLSDGSPDAIKNLLRNLFEDL